MNDFKSFENKRKKGKVMVEILEDMDELLGSNEYFLLSNWLEAAKAKAQTLEEREIYEWNARCQITLWSSVFNNYVRKIAQFNRFNNELIILIVKVDDYACKAWAGLIKE